jgi:pilus assembly protein CpaF
MLSDSLSPNLQTLFRNPQIEDIVLAPRGLAFCAEGQWHGPFSSDETSHESLQKWARWIAECTGVTLGLTLPAVDGFLTLEGSTFRAHVVISPLVLSGPEITFRRVPPAGHFLIQDFTDSAELAESLANDILNQKNFLIAGATGSGKTSFLSALLGVLPKNCRILILEDSPELPLPNTLSSKLVARTDRFGLRQGVSWELSDLVIESLRMRPDRMVLGECRGSEARAIRQALMTGHSGMMTTLHAGSAEQALQRFESLAGDSCKGLFHRIVHLACNDKGERKIQEIAHG